MKIKDLLKHTNPCWKYAAMEPCGRWYLYKNKPRTGKTCATWVDDILPAEHRALDTLESIFDIEPFEGDWKDSLICREEVRIMKGIDYRLLVKAMFNPNYKPPQPPPWEQPKNIENGNEKGRNK